MGTPVRGRERCVRARIHTKASSGLPSDEREGGRENSTLKYHSGQASSSNLGDVK